MNCGQVVSEDGAVWVASSVSIVENFVTYVFTLKRLKYICKYPDMCFVLKWCLGIFFDSPLCSLGMQFCTCLAFWKLGDRCLVTYTQLYLYIIQQTFLKKDFWQYLMTQWRRIVVIAWLCMSLRLTVFTFLVKIITKHYNVKRAETLRSKAVFCYSSV